MNTTGLAIVCAIIFGVGMGIVFGIAVATQPHRGDAFFGQGEVVKASPPAPASPKKFADFRKK